jgi:hypothetical protein
MRSDKGLKRNSVRKDRGMPKVICAELNVMAMREKLAVVWRSMMYRCYTKDADAFSRYGGRGIQVCPEWHNSETFIKWALVEGYQHGKTLERIENDGWYSPSNCIWATYRAQARNRRSNRIIECHGRFQTLAAWADELGISTWTLHYRLKRTASPEEAFALPKPKRFGFTANGETKSLKAWAEGLDVDSTTLSHRMRVGLSFEQALVAPKRIGKKLPR